MARQSDIDTAFILVLFDGGFRQEFLDTRDVPAYLRIP